MCVSGIQQKARARWESKSPLGALFGVLVASIRLLRLVYASGLDQAFIIGFVLKNTRLNRILTLLGKMRFSRVFFNTEPKSLIEAMIRLKNFVLIPSVETKSTKYKPDRGQGFRCLMIERLCRF